MKFFLAAAIFAGSSFCASFDNVLITEHVAKRPRLAPLPTKIIDILPGVKFRYPQFLPDGTKEPMSINKFDKNFWVSPRESLATWAKNSEIITICGGYSYIYTRLAYDSEITECNTLFYRMTPYRIHLAPKHETAKIFLGKLLTKSFNIGMYLSKEYQGNSWVGLGTDNVYAGTIEQWINSLTRGLKDDVEHSGRFSEEEISTIKRFDLFNPDKWGVFAMFGSYALSKYLTKSQIEKIEAGEFPEDAMCMDKATAQIVMAILKKHVPELTEK